MSLGGILLSGLGLQERERQREREKDREEEERRRKRRHRSHRHTGDGDIRYSHAPERRRGDGGARDDGRRSYADGYTSSRKDQDYVPRRKSTVTARGTRERGDGAPHTVVPRPYEGQRQRSSHTVSMRRTPSTSSRESTDARDTPPTTPGDASYTWSPPKQQSSTSTVRPEIQMRGAAQRREHESSTEDDYTHLTPGKRKLRTGDRAEGARGTDFMVGVRSDIGSISSGSDTESEHEQPPRKGTHLKIVTRPCAADKMMTGALPPGSSPHRTTGPPTSRPLVSRTNSKQSDSFLSQLLRPSPHHANVKRSSTLSSRPGTRAVSHAPSTKQHSTSKRNIASPAASPIIARRRVTAPIVPNVSEAPALAPAPAPEPKPEPEPEATVECLTCCDEVPAAQAAKLECGHIMCTGCLKRVFELSVTDPAHMPPKCCTERNIPLQFVAPLFDNKFKILWNKKFQEFSTKDRMYCPKKGCGEWIQPADQKVDKTVGRRYGVCGKCKTKVCKKCNMRWHGSKDCQNDKDTKQLLDTAKKEGWQRCYNCKAMVQLAEGCNHMKCRCTAEFCMICGSKWKTCDCPWFNTPPENPMGGMFFPPLNPFRPRVRMRADPNGGPPRPVLDPGGHRGQGGFAAEMAARRAQEQADEELARMLQMGDIADEQDPFAHHHPNQHRAAQAFARPDFGPGAANGVGAAVGAFGLLAQIARLAIDNMNDDGDLNNNHNNNYETHRRQMRLGRNNATIQAAWTRPRRRATVNERSRARAPDPPTPIVDVVEDPDTQSDGDEGRSDVDEFERVRRRREARRRRRSLNGSPARPSAAAMAGLGLEGRRGRDRVGGWLDHIAGGGPNPFQYEV